MSVEREKLLLVCIQLFDVRAFCPWDGTVMGGMDAYSFAYMAKCNRIAFCSADSSACSLGRASSRPFSSTQNSFSYSDFGLLCCGNNGFLGLSQSFDSNYLGRISFVFRNNQFR